MIFVFIKNVSKPKFIFLIFIHFSSNVIYIYIYPTRSMVRLHSSRFRGWFKTEKALQDTSIHNFKTFSEKYYLQCVNPYHVYLSLIDLLWRDVMEILTAFYQEYKSADLKYNILRFQIYIPTVSVKKIYLHFQFLCFLCTCIAYVWSLLRILALKKKKKKKTCNRFEFWNYFRHCQNKLRWSQKDLYNTYYS